MEEMIMTKEECFKKVRERLKKARGGLREDFSYYQGMVTGIEKALEIFGMMQEPSLPSGVDKAAEEYVDKWYSIHGLDRESYPIDVEVSKADFYAGAKWASEQGETAEVGYWNQRGLSIKLDKPLEKLGFEEGDKVTILISKK